VTVAKDELQKLGKQDLHLLGWTGTTTTPELPRHLLRRP